MWRPQHVVLIVSANIPARGSRDWLRAANGGRMVGRPMEFLALAAPDRQRYRPIGLQAMALPPNNSVNRTQIPLRGLCAGYLGRQVSQGSRS
jgi:hypothetical protein